MRWIVYPFVLFISGVLPLIKAMVPPFPMMDFRPDERVIKNYNITDWLALYTKIVPDKKEMLVEVNLPLVTCLPQSRGLKCKTLHGVCEVLVVKNGLLQALCIAYCLGHAFILNSLLTSLFL